MNTPLLIDISGGMARWNIKSRNSIYKLLAELEAQGKRAAIKDGSRTKIVVQVVDDYYASLPSAQLKRPAEPSQSAPWLTKETIPVTAPITTSEAPARRGRGRPRKHPLPHVDGPPLAPEQAPSSSIAGEDV
jgi:hypothetical protein